MGRDIQPEPSQKCHGFWGSGRGEIFNQNPFKTAMGSVSSGGLGWGELFNQNPLSNAMGSGSSGGLGGGRYSTRTLSVMPWVLGVWGSGMGRDIQPELSQKCHGFRGSGRGRDIQPEPSQ